MGVVAVAVVVLLVPLQALEYPPRPTCLVYCACLTSETIHDVFGDNCPSGGSRAYRPLMTPSLFAVLSPDGQQPAVPPVSECGEQSATEGGLL